MYKKLIAVATGEIKHAGNGLCPDPIEGFDSRDPDCPPCKLHGLRMLDPEVFSRMPLASADSTNAAVNCSASSRFGIYTPATSSQRAAVIADRIEAHNSAPIWTARPEQLAWAI